MNAIKSKYPTIYILFVNTIINYWVVLYEHMLFFFLMFFIIFYFHLEQVVKS